MFTKADIQLVRSLSERRVRDAEGVFVAEGEKLIGELLDSDFVVRRLFQTEPIFADSCAEQVSVKDMERMSNLKSANKALAVVEQPRYGFDWDDVARRLILAVDDVQNPGNLGTIIRLADWFGIEDVVCSRATVDCFNPKVIQATMGAIIRVRVHYADLEQFLDRASECGADVFGAYLDGENIYRSQLPSGGVIVVGNEGRGIKESVGERVSRRIFIPPYPPQRVGSESLNVSVATAVICSEFRRRG